MDGSVFGSRRRERIAFLAKSGKAGLGRRKAGLGRSKASHFYENVQNGRGESVFGLHRRERIAVLAEVWKPAGPHIKAEGKAYVKDKTYD